MSDGKMQAVVVREYGGPEVLRLEQIDRPVPGAGEALVKIRYASVIPLDWKIRSGSAHNVFPKTFPYVPGFYASGVIEALGPGVTDFKVGDRVFGAFDGAYAEYGVAPAVRPDGAENPEGAVPAKALVKMPDGLSFEDAAAIRAGADAAWHALFAEGNLQAGQTVLIHAAAGGVGQFAVQLAKWKRPDMLQRRADEQAQMLRTRPGRRRKPLIQQEAELVADGLLEQREFVGKMGVERPPVHVRPIGDVLDRHRGEPFFPHQFQKRPLEQLPRPPAPAVFFLSVHCRQHAPLPLSVPADETRQFRPFVG